MNSEALLIALIGAAILAARLVNALFRQLHVPSLVGHLALGLLLALSHEIWGILTPTNRATFSFLADLGVIVLLFRVGLETRIATLLKQLPKAAPVWVGNTLIAAAAGYAITSLMGYSFVPSLVVATAMVATSVGVSVAIWQEQNILDSRDGAILLDVAELDDIAGVALMGLLLSILPVLGQSGAQVWQTAATETALFIAKFAAFAGFCLIFARFIEGRLPHLFADVAPPREFMLLIVGVGLVVSALASSLGLSLAIGALFAGFIFSRDPEAVRTEASFDDIHAFFAPFFFIGIGLQVDVGALFSALPVGLMLLAAAVVGKIIGAGLPALLVLPAWDALAIGISMVPRAEIAMIVMHEARRFGSHVVPDPLFAGMVLVVAATTTLSALLLRPLLKRIQVGDGSAGG